MPTDVAEAKGPVRLLVRMAGLSTADLAPFSSDLPSRLDRQEDLARGLEAARQKLVDRLHRAIPEAGPEARGFLLEVKRDAYNGRSLTSHRNHPLWPELELRAGGGAARVLALEARLEADRRDYEAAYGSRREVEHQQLLRLRDRRPFTRGLALASPALATALDRLAQAFDGGYDRKQRKAAHSLLRYASRAAYKLSPYSTFTPVALAEVCNGGSAAGQGGDRRTVLRLRPGSRCERSLLRARSFLPSQWVHLLSIHRPLRSRLRVTLNSSVTEVAPGRLLWLRPGAWTTGTGNKLEYRSAALVALDLRGPLVDWLRTELPSRELTYRELVSTLGRELAGADEPAATRDELIAAVEQLLDAGLLCLLAPWPLDEAYLERRLVEYLKGLPGEADLRGIESVIEGLERLVELQLGFAQSEEPNRVVRRLHGLLREIWDALLRLGGDPRELEADWSHASVLYEDVFLTSRGSGRVSAEQRDTVLELPRETLDDLVQACSPLVRVCDLVNRRHDLHLALTTLMKRRWPHRSEVGFVELLAAASELWGEFARFDLDARERREPWATFDPWALPAAAELLSERRRVFEAFADCIESNGEESRIRKRRLAKVAGAIPEKWLSPVGVSLLVQPADRSGRRWVLNRLTEGTGRQVSRFTPVMDPDARAGLLSHLTARSRLDCAGEPCELLDLALVQGDTLNVHAPQTHLLLEPPGETLDLPPERRVTLRDLRIRRCGGGCLRLTDGGGRTLLPVYLGVADLAYLPVWLKFLARLGPGELELQQPGSTVRSGAAIETRERLTLGRLVLYRRRWRIAAAALPRDLGRLGDPRTFAALHRWRRGLDLPERFFAIERRSAPGRREIFKPQYLDLSSPLFAEIFLGLLESQGDEALVLEEALPEPDAYPVDGGKGRRAVEVVVEGLAAPSPPPPEVGET